jgi:tRNA-modifying protein YgfZ
MNLPSTSLAWIPTGAVRVTGSDRVPFVHGQSTNDVRGLPTPGGHRALILNAKGQIEFDVRVFKRRDDLYLQTAPGLGAAVLERLQRYVVFDDVQLEDITGKIRVAHLAGETALETAANLGFDAAGPSVQLLETEIAGTLLASKTDRGLGTGLDVHVLASRAEALRGWLESEGIISLESSPPESSLPGSSTLESARILAGLPDAHADRFLGMLPQEFGLEFAVSYRKGCYIGQEIMARLEARGHTNRELARVRSDHTLEPGSALTFEGRGVGSVGSSVTIEGGWVALAVVRKDVPDGADLETQGVTVRLERLEKTARV